MTTDRNHSRALVFTALQTVVLIKRVDPRDGETTYRISDIKRGEPSSALFALPVDYKIKDEEGRDITAARPAQ